MNNTVTKRDKQRAAEMEGIILGLVVVLALVLLAAALIVP